MTMPFTNRPMPMSQSRLRLPLRTKRIRVVSKPGSRTGEDVYAVQLIASAKRVPPKDRQFKSYRGKVTEFVTGGRFRYKYCVGRFDTRKQAEAKLAEVRREFRDAFVVSCRGDRIVQ